MVEQMYHITTQARWEQIQKDEVLEARSDPWRGIADEDKWPLVKVIADRPHLVGIPPENFESWREYGGLQILTDYIGKRDRAYESEDRNELIVLEVPVKAQGTFVKNYTLETPKGMDQFHKGLYGSIQEWFSTCSLSDLSREEWAAWKDIQRKTRESVVPLRGYEKDYVVPEIWMPCSVSTQFVNTAPAIL